MGHCMEYSVCNCLLPFFPFTFFCTFYNAWCGLKNWKCWGEESEQNGATFIFEFNKSSIDAVPFICEDLGTLPNNWKFSLVGEKTPSFISSITGQSIIWNDFQNVTLPFTIYNVTQIIRNKIVTVSFLWKEWRKMLFNVLQNLSKYLKITRAPNAKSPLTSPQNSNVRLNLHNSSSNKRPKPSWRSKAQILCPCLPLHIDFFVCFCISSLFRPHLCLRTKSFSVC